MIVQSRGSSSHSNSEGNSIVSIFRKVKDVTNVVASTNDNILRNNRKFTKLAKYYSSIF